MIRTRVIGKSAVVWSFQMDCSVTGTVGSTLNSNQPHRVLRVNILKEPTPVVENQSSINTINLFKRASPIGFSHKLRFSIPGSITSGAQER
ncbi:MAG: hypothetical protein ACYSWZ_03685 [Planctomycetota bacterium]|jgi:hypothetical protein